MAWTEQGALKGPKGDKGDTGPVSTTPGPKGADGTNGAKGDTGAAGARGSKWFFGTANPTTVAGSIVGDCYLNTSTGNVFLLV